MAPFNFMGDTLQSQGQKLRRIGSGGQQARVEFIGPGNQLPVFRKQVQQQLGVQEDRFHGFQESQVFAADREKNDDGLATEASSHLLHEFPVAVYPLAGMGKSAAKVMGLPGGRFLFQL